MARIDTLLFDLDGTLIDTAPDMFNALNAIRAEEGMGPLAYADVRAVVSHGGAAMARLAFGEQLPEAEFNALKQRFLDHYLSHIAQDSRLFDGLNELLGEVEQRGMKWGVVTNKPSWLTDPLMAELGLTKRAACIVSGDTTSERKPHPLPLMHGCEQAGSRAEQCLYVGDAERDIEAGRRAGMTTIVALFGYLGKDDRPTEWLADGMIQHPRELWDWVG